MTMDVFSGKIIILLFFLFFAVTSDLKKRRIPNQLTVSFALIGFGFNVAVDFPRGILTSVLGFIAGFLIFLLPYLMKAMGAGDIKLMAALGAITDWKTVLTIALFSALSGGIIVIAARIFKGGMIRTLKRTWNLILFYFFSLIYEVTLLPTMALRKENNRIDVSDKQKDFIPYAVAIAAGSVIALFLLRPEQLHALSL